MRKFVIELKFGELCYGFLIPFLSFFSLHFMYLMSGQITVKSKICTLMDTKWHPTQ